jgi:hypothetical protein
MGQIGRCPQLKDEGARDTLRRTGAVGRGVVPVTVGKVGGVDRSVLCDELRRGIFLVLMSCEISSVVGSQRDPGGNRMNE